MAAHETTASSGAHTTVDGDIVDRLVSVLESAGADGAVHDVCDRGASYRFNNDETLVHRGRRNRRARRQRGAANLTAARSTQQAERRGRVSGPRS